MKEEVILWIIRWGDPYALECKTMTRSEVEAYAREKQKKARRYICNQLKKRITATDALKRWRSRLLLGQIYCIK